MKEKYYIKCTDASNSDVIQVGITYDIEKCSLVAGGNKKVWRTLVDIVTNVFGVVEESLESPVIRQVNKIRYVNFVSSVDFRKGIDSLWSSDKYKLYNVPCDEVKKLHQIM